MSDRQERPNILLIMSDQQRWDTILGRSGCRTPHLNALASEGVAFERSYTPVSLCCPARAMLLSGAYGWHNGVFNQVHVPERMQAGMHDDTVTYALRLRAMGYRTGYVGKWHAHWRKSPLDFGYSRASAPSSYGPEALQRANFRPDDLYVNATAQHPNRIVASKELSWPGGHPWPVWQESDGPLEGRHPHFVASRGIQMLDEFCQQTEPWLLEVHFPEPHDPFNPHVSFAQRYDWRDIPLPTTWHEEHRNKPGMNRREAATYNALNEEDVRQAVAHYWAYNEELDYNVGRVLQTLEDSGRADNTLVVCTTDHGELLGSHHMFIKGWQPYEETHRIPMLARWPGVIPQGSQAPQLVHLHDWAHTFCHVAGAEPLPFADGVDLSAILATPNQVPSRDALMNTYYGGEFLYTQRIVITERYKYVFNGFDMDELYDLEADPGEIENRANDTTYAGIAAGLRRQLYALMEQHNDPYSGPWLYDAGRYLENPDA